MTARVTLAELVEVLGPAVLSVVCAPRGLDRPVSAPELLDIADPAPVEPGALLLGIGLAPSQDGLSTAIRRAAAGQAAGLVIKSRGLSLAEVRAVAEQAGLAVLDAAAEMPWPRLQVLCGAVLRFGPASAAGIGPPLATVPTGDLFALANATAALAGGAVAIMDTDHVILAYSSLDGQRIDETRRRGILLRRVPEDALPYHLLAEVWNSQEPVRLARPGDMVRFGLVIRAGPAVLGSIWVAVEDDADLSRCAPALHEAAKLAALHLVRLRRQADADQDRRNAVLGSALDGAGEAAGLELPAHLLALAPPVAADPIQRRLTGSQLVDLAVLAGRAIGIEIAATVARDRLYLLLPGGHAQATIFARQLLDRAGASLRTPARAVLGPAVTTPAQLPAQRADADAALDHLRDNEITGLVELDSVRTQLVLHRLATLVRARPDLRTGLAERIRDHDERGGADYARTLLTYLRAAGDISAVAETLHLHQNTVRQRLRRAEELFELNLADPELRLTLWLELAADLPPGRGRETHTE
ncbi:helix-turn-helix domain-containing protein [Crossiella sp. SN42]|uniref:PucR family transcriptional regulator n=1 Tax=Crossiella sp. SN42 TaxID=2944808 RepID=UPI00207D6CB6|nr:helix-turn-helix domain-containing protein [Crossiella sp. SN42]MCO1574635.1 helix-turn-helix domain-containing protein [Crossiella sp. SN42]